MPPSTRVPLVFADAASPSPPAMSPPPSSPSPSPSPPPTPPRNPRFRPKETGRTRVANRVGFLSHLGRFRASGLLGTYGLVGLGLVGFIFKNKKLKQIGPTGWGPIRAKERPDHWLGLALRMGRFGQAPIRAELGSGLRPDPTRTDRAESGSGQTDPTRFAQLFKLKNIYLKKFKKNLKFLIFKKKLIKKN